MVLLELITFDSFMQSDVCPGQTDIWILKSKSFLHVKKALELVKQRFYSHLYSAVCQRWISKYSDSDYIHYIVLQIKS